MKRLTGLLVATVIALGIVPAHAAEHWIEVKLDRQKDGQPVSQRAVLSIPDRGRSDTVVLFFRGGHGIPMLRSVNEWRPHYSAWLGPNIGLFWEAGIATAIVDCPTDEWGPVEGNKAVTCLDTYRAGEQHANDVRAIIDRLKKNHGFKRIFVLGHSKGSLSSRWLAVNLGNEINGSIHSASMSQTDPWGNGKTIASLPYEKMTAPTIWVHHQNDPCPTTKYSEAKRHAGERIITVRGGTPKGEICAGHYHGYEGRGRDVSRAIVAWIKDGTLHPFAGEP